MKILIDARMIRHTGIGRYIRGLLEFLPASDGGANTYRAITDRRARLNGGKGSGNAGVSAAGTIFPVPVYSIREQVMLPLEVMRAGADIVHYPSFNIPVAGRGPMVTTIHDLYYYMTPGDTAGRMRHLAAKTLLRRAAAVSRKIITVSGYTKGELVRLLGVDPAKIEVIHNGVGPEYRPVSFDDASGALTRLGLEPGYILYTGCHQPRKNLKGLLSVYSRLKDPPRLVITGRRDPRRASLYAGAERAGSGARVVFTGDVPDADLPALYSQASLLVFPSFFEGFGLPPLEAMACGTPVVASNVTSIPEVTGGAALLVPPQDYPAMAGAIGRVLSDEDLRASLVEAGLARAERFSWKTTAEKTLRVYEETVSA